MRLKRDTIDGATNVGDPTQTQDLNAPKFNTIEVPLIGQVYLSSFILVNVLLAFIIIVIVAIVLLYRRAKRRQTMEEENQP